MLKRLKITIGAVGAFAALALGGAAIAGATSPTPTQAPAPVATSDTTSTPDVGNVQVGDQSAPDTASANAADGATTADTADTASEPATSETATASDGPGGYADTNPNADTQQQGQN